MNGDPADISSVADAPDEPGGSKADTDALDKKAVADAAKLARMREPGNDGCFWVPAPAVPLKQGDILWNVPSTILSLPVTKVLRSRSDRSRATLFEDDPEGVDVPELAVGARWGSLSMIVTPTCHLSETEKDQEYAAIVPIDLVRVEFEAQEQDIVSQGKRPLHAFHLPPTNLGSDNGLIKLDMVAMLDRPTTIAKAGLREHRRLGLISEARLRLRVQLGHFWIRGNVEAITSKQWDDWERGAPYASRD